MALGEPLPKQIFGHPWLLQGEGKMSKSKGNVMYADDLVELFGVDVVRYFVLHEMPFENDGVISYELLVERLNSDLANVLGNLVNRTISMSNKYFGGTVSATGEHGGQEEIDKEVEACIAQTYGKVAAKMDELRVADAISEVFNLLKRLNKYIDETEPWKLAKDESAAGRLSQVLYMLSDGIMTGASLLAPFLPETAEKIAKQMNCPLFSYDRLSAAGNFPSGTQVTDKPEILFARRDIKEVLEEVEKRNSAA